ncbi:hypothetical protein [Solemya elarraichensis gill symbiont]|uniref:Uncharacterized protein n=1 Tax=Solemya elarraichensis gill symbiont TaxID=1918949 RepID=A0A1T2LC04_9GAMM|nr:hypothetical protein [Solemya elarraichensis gill symbiont]OOZ42476.1 hypothetical protein BOW52_03075 [Solemya elarraichensis gill symbiont]
MYKSLVKFACVMLATAILIPTNLNGGMLSDLRPKTSKTKSGMSGQAASKASHVIVDQSEKGFIVFTGVPQETDKAMLKEYRAKASKLDKVVIVSWQQFLDNIQKYFLATVLRNDYPKSKVVDGLICLVGKQPAAPCGLTWNGGIALTRMDYNHVRKTYQTYKADPDKYKPIRNPKADPVNPKGHLPYFGCDA